SIIGGRSVYETRRQIGVELARESPVEADLVCPVPDSGTPAAIGFAQESGIPYGMGIIRNQYMGRTFIEPTDQIRNMGVRLKLNVNRALIEGKRVRSEEHTSELQSREKLVCRRLLEKKKERVNGHLGGFQHPAG